MFANRSPMNRVTTIQKIINKMDFNPEDVQDLTVKVKFTVNDNNELIVLSTGDSKIDSRIKDALNYTAVDPGLKQYKVYVLPVRFESNT